MKAPRPAAVNDMAKERNPYRDRITIDPRIMVGKPVVRGTRIPVEAVLAHLADNPDLTDLLQAYPRLTREDVQACLAFAGERLQKTPRAARAARARPAQPAGA